MEVVKIFLRLLKKKPHELNFIKIRRSKCSVNLKLRCRTLQKIIREKLKVEEIKRRVTSTSRGFEVQIS